MAGLHSSLLPSPSGTVTAVLSLSFSSSSSHLSVWISSAGSCSILFLFLHASSAPVIVVSCIVSSVLEWHVLQPSILRVLEVMPLFSHQAHVQPDKRKAGDLCASYSGSWHLLRRSREEWKAFLQWFIKFPFPQNHWLWGKLGIISDIYQVIFYKWCKATKKRFFSDSRRFDGDISLLRVFAAGHPDSGFTWYHSSSQILLMWRGIRTKWLTQQRGELSLGKGKGLSLLMWHFKLHTILLIFYFMPSHSFVSGISNDLGTIFSLCKFLSVWNINLCHWHWWTRVKVSF